MVNLLKKNYRGHVNPKLFIPAQFTLYLVASSFLSMAIIALIVQDLSLTFYSLIGILSTILITWILSKLHNQIVVFDANLYKNVFVKVDPSGVETFLLLFYDLQAYYNLKGINYKGSPINSEALVFDDLLKIFSTLFHSEGTNVTNLFISSRGFFFSFYDNLTQLQKETLSRHYQVLLEKIN